jgi:hypothetical protein
MKLRDQAGFVLLEALLAVAIFAIGVLALGRCVNNCMAAERWRNENALAMRVLENRSMEIEGGAVALETAPMETLKSPFDGMKLKQTVTPLKMKNEKNEDLVGMVTVKLLVTWISDHEPRERSLTYYAHIRQQ